MNIVFLDPAFEPTFWEHVNQDIPHYYFFAYDWKHRRNDTKILLALKNDRIGGMMLILNERIVQLRGSSECAKAFLERLDLEEVELQAPEQHEQYVLEKYKPAWSHELVLMTLRKGEERFQIPHQITALDSSDAEQIAVMMRNVDPEFWGEATREQVAKRMSNVQCFGVKVDGELVSLGRARLTEQIGHIPTVATLEAHRNKGYATSIVSHMVKLILEKMPVAIIYVLSDNLPAIRVYEKVGFKPYKKYFFMRGEKR